MEQPAESRGRIMVVDDDPDTVAVLSHYLRREGFTPVEAGSGADCIRILADVGPVDVILLDLMMPDMDGFAVCRALKRNPVTAEIPIIMVTARDDLDARTEGIRQGISDFLAKPVLRKQLGNRIIAQLDIVEAAKVAAQALDRLSRGKAAP